MFNTANSITPVDLSDVTFIKRITIGNINPGAPLGSEDEQERQIVLLNRCLNDFPKGRIVGRETAVGIFRIPIGQEDNQLMVQRITYHVGFKRKPDWL